MGLKITKPESRILTPKSLRRYARHIVLPEIGEGGQEKLLASSVLVIGAGGLGSAALGYLAAAGVGKLGIVEPDRVELSNLQRQILFEEADIGNSKAAAARDRLNEINPDCAVEIFATRLDEKNAREFVAHYDIVLDCSDNFTTRFALADACAMEKKPLISAALSGWSGQLTTFKPYLGSPHPCYHCFISEMPEREASCAQEGIIGPLAGVMGSLQALEVIREILDLGSASGRLFKIDALTLSITSASLSRDQKCPSCGMA